MRKSTNSFVAFLSVIVIAFAAIYGAVAVNWATVWGGFTGEKTYDAGYHAGFNDSEEDNAIIIFDLQTRIAELQSQVETLTLSNSDKSAEILELENEIAELQQSIADIEAGRTPAPSFATDSWEAIAAASAAGTAATIYSVGDEKMIKLTTGEYLTFVILEFNHDDLSDGSGKAGITIGMQNLMENTAKMNATNTNIGGWDSSEMRTVTLANIFTQLPSDLQSSIKNVAKKSNNGFSTTIQTSNDKLFLFTEKEIYGVERFSAPGEGVQYDYWKTIKNGANPDRVKYRANGTGETYTWWLRSSNMSGPPPTGFCAISNSGNALYKSAASNYGICFGFCV